MLLSNPAMDSLGQDVALPAAPNALKNGHKCQAVLENLYDSYTGYKTCAEDCTESPLTILFQQVAARRLKFIDQLSSVLRSDFGFEPVTSGSNLEAVHETWINVKAWLTDGLDKAAILAEVHRAEAHLIEHYIAALSEPEHLTDKVWRVLQEQLKNIKEQDASLYDL